MKRCFLVILVVILFSFCLTGCANERYLQEKENEVVISNRKIETILTLYEENLSFVRKNTDIIWSSLFYDNGNISEDLFYNSTDSIEFVILSQKITKTCKKYELDINEIRNESTVYSFLDDSDGSVLMYYTIPLGNTIMYIEIVVQNGLIYSIEY